MRPNIAVGDYVKIYENFRGFGRLDVVCAKVNNRTGVIDTTVPGTQRQVKSIPHRDDATDATLVYWTELPVGFTPT